MITLLSKLNDSNNDGKVVLGKDWAKKLNLPIGTVLTYIEGTTYNYLVGDETGDWVCQAPASPNVTASPVDLGASNLKGWGDGEISNYHVLVGGNLIAPSQPLTGLKISDIKADKVSSLLMQSSKATLNDLSISRVDIGARNRAIFIRGESKDILIEDTHVYKVGGPADPSDYPMGIQLGAKVSPGNDSISFIVRRTLVENFATTLPEGKSGYLQGDNIMVEAGEGPGLFEDVRVVGATDGGFDCKLSNVTFRRVEAESNHTNYKIWGQNVVMESVRSITPRPNTSGSGSPTCGFWFPSDLDAEYNWGEVEFIGEHTKHIVNGGAGKVTLNIKKCNLKVEDMIVAKGKGLIINIG